MQSWFLLECGVKKPAVLTENLDGVPFQLQEPGKKKKAMTETRGGQHKFKFLVRQRYGAQCAVSGISVSEVLDAAHIFPKSENGSDDPRNGLVLSANHHRAYDAKLWAIHPESLRIVRKPGGPDLEPLGIVHSDLSHLRNLPATEALQWAWDQVTAEWNKTGRSL